MADDDSEICFLEVSGLVRLIDRSRERESDKRGGWLDNHKVGDQGTPAFFF